jgi:hypothetical protein
VLWQWAGGGLPLPQAKAPSTIARLVILFGSESYCQGSGPFVLRGGGRSRKLAVALLGVHTPSKNLAPVSWIQGHIACARLKCGFDGGGIGSKLLRVAAWMARSFEEVYECFLPSTLSVLSKKWPLGICAALLMLLYCYGLVLAKGGENPHLYFCQPKIKHKPTHTRG